jgi:hypothetical protein
VYVVAVGESVSQPLEDDDAHAAAADSPLRLCIERTAMTIG